MQHQEQALGAQTLQFAELKAQNESLRAVVVALQGRDAAHRAETATLAARLEQLEAAAPCAATLARR